LFSLLTALRPPLIVLYLVEIWMVLKPGSPFKSSFYSLFVASAVVDLIFVIGTLHEYRLKMFPLVNGMFENYSCQECVRTRMALSFMCPFTQDLLNCFIALNRLTSIWRPVTHSSIWKKLLPFAVGFSHFLSIFVF
ncbi:hypothetical protein PENTCL1PPCAC_15097, partial [Pristionchus entomophagus]